MGIGDRITAFTQTEPSKDDYETEEAYAVALSEYKTALRNHRITVADAVAWCNLNNAELSATDDGYEIVERSLTTEQLSRQARAKRDDLLSSVEWRVTRYNTQVQAGITPTEGDIKPVLEYMQKLRDLPEQEGWPENITWPTVV
jgi:hypothetical protein